jgi:hypothetical protein
MFDDQLCCCLEAAAALHSKLQALVTFGAYMAQILAMLLPSHIGVKHTALPPWPCHLLSISLTLPPVSAVPGVKPPTSSACALSDAS